jgi:hypothetical protein
MHGMNVGKKYNASKQFYRYIRPGASRMETSSPDSNLFITAYYHAGNNTHTIVILNSASSSKTVSISGSNLPAAYDMYVTSATQNNQLTTNVAATGITIPARSVVTLQAGGTPLQSLAATGPVASLPLAGSEEVKNDAVVIYPNPLRSGKLTVQLSAEKHEEAVFTLLNNLSQPVIEVKRALAKGNNIISVPVDGVTGGLYFLRIRQGDKQTLKKVMIEK